MSNCTSNINPLYNNYFKLLFNRGTRQFELMCQRANLPGLTIGEATQPTTLGVTIPYATTSVQFEPLKVEFVVDYDLKNWKSLYSWMRNITNIENDTEYNLNYEDWHINATLQILDPIDCYSSELTVTFFNVIPISLSGINFQTDNQDVVTVKANASFKYSYYKLDPDAPTDLTQDL